MLMAAIVISCGGSKLFERKTPDGGVVVVKQELFSGIDHLYIEKKNKHRLAYYMFYDCECGVNKSSLRKGVISDNGTRTLWIAVTDTVGQAAFFDQIIDINRFTDPVEFLPITSEEISILKEGIDRSEKACCKNPSRSIDKVIGFLSIKTN